MAARSKKTVEKTRVPSRTPEMGQQIKDVQLSGDERVIVVQKLKMAVIVGQNRGDGRSQAARVARAPSGRTSWPLTL